MTVAEAVPVPPAVGRRGLAHLPGAPGSQLLGDTLHFLKDPAARDADNYRKYGSVYRSRSFVQWVVVMLGPDALEHVMADREHNFSARGGWTPFLGRLFPGGLMLRDFDDHRMHRRLMRTAFTPPALADYLVRMNRSIAARLGEWADAPDLRFYRAAKRLTLDIGASTFLGLDVGPEARRINQAFVDELHAAVAFVRWRVPGLALDRGIRARRFLVARFGELVPERRKGDGDDTFTKLCHATDEDGKALTDEEIVNHVNFLLMAAHDTTTSSLTVMFWALAGHPEWQEAIRERIHEIGGDEIGYDDLPRMDQTERVFREALRLFPPVPGILRRAIRDFEFDGHRIPAGATIKVSPAQVQRMPELWTDPERFDPERFAPDRAEDRRHRYAFAPFGGGAHKCLGMHFADIQVKAFTFQLLRRYRVSLPPDYVPSWRRLPSLKPRDELPVRLTPL